MPASTALWAHLLRNDTLGPPPNSRIIVPPVAPLDKNGTSMRILLHDTQANFEKFSARVDKLTAGVDDAKREITLVKTLFQREHETLIGDIIDLVNRSQTEIQKSLGTPAQSPLLEHLTKDLDRRLQALDQRIDAIQLLNQAYSQTLQVQSQALQSIQDQHRTVLAALMPLLPLLQAIPLHIESAQNNIKDALTKSTSTVMLSSERSRKPSARMQGRKRSSSTFRTEDPFSSPLSNKRPRADTAQNSDGPLRTGDKINALVCTQSPKAHAGKENDSTWTPLLITATATAPARQEIASFNDAYPPPSCPNVDELFTPPRSKSHTHKITRTPTHVTLLDSQTEPRPFISSPFSLVQRVRSIISPDATADSKPLIFESTEEFSSNPPNHHSPLTKKNSPSPSFHTERPPSSIHKTPKHPTSSSQFASKVPYLRSSARNQSTLSVKQSLAPQPPPPSQPRQLRSNKTRIPLDQPPLEDSATAQQSPLAGVGRRAGIEKGLLPTAKMRERRSPFREGRRFIPLGDSDDDE